MSGVFVVFEGGDGVGKTTQAGMLEVALRERGYAVRRTFEPGDTYAGAAIRRILLEPQTGELNPRAEALLYAADKAEHVARVVRPALAAGEVVVCDRYVDSLLAYQGAHGMDVAALARLCDWATESLRPDLTVLLDLDPAQAVGEKAAKDRVEGYPDAFHQQARASFRRLAAEDPGRYLILPAREPAADIAARVLARVEELAAARGCRSAAAD